MAKACFPTSTSPSVRVQPTSGDSVPIYIHDPLPSPVKIAPIREQDSQSDIDGQFHEPSESDEKGPWDRKNLLTFNDGGVCGFYRLLLLKKLMADIA